MWNEAKLDALLTEPSAALVADMRRMEGDILVLGAGGKMGPSLCLLARKAADRAGVTKRIIAVSRFSDAQARAALDSQGIETIACDLQDNAQLAALPDAENILYMAGRKFGTHGSEWRTWGMNATLPVFVADRFRGARMVVFSSGNIYPLAPLHAPCTEEQPPQPIGEYATSCLARERAFEYASHVYGTRVLQFRLSFAVDLRYGVLHDIASAVLHERPISLRTPMVNCIWQGSANEYALRALLLAESPAKILNITGPEVASVRATALRFGALFGKTPIFTGEEQQSGYLADPSQAMALLGYPSVSLHTLVQWQAAWLQADGRTLDKPTHFEERGGVY